jgi:hypothetical protein
MHDENNTSGTPPAQGALNIQTRRAINVNNKPERFEMRSADPTTIMRIFLAVEPLISANRQGEAIINIVEALTKAFIACVACGVYTEKEVEFLIDEYARQMKENVTQGLVNPGLRKALEGLQQ